MLQWEEYQKTQETMKKKLFSQGISVYNIEKTLGQQKECQRPAAMQLVAPQAIRSLREQLNQNHEKKYEKQQ